MSAKSAAKERIVGQEVESQSERHTASPKLQALSTPPARAQTLSSAEVLDALKMILVDAPLNDVLTSVALLIEAHVPGMLCSIFLLDEDGLHLRYGAAANLPQSYLAATDGVCIGPSVGSCGAAAYLRQPVFVSDILSHPNWANFRGVVLQSGLRAAWSTPIMSHDGKVLGTFCMYYREARHPSPGEIQLIDYASRIRVLAATHCDLNALVAEGKFRQDLLYRLNVVPIEMPSLRDRATDIPLLVEYFMDRFGKKAGKKFRTIDRETLKLFQAYGWPGNVRELQNVIERAVILSDGDTFSVDETWVKSEPPQVTSPRVALNGALLRQEKEMIEAALAESHGRISGPTGAAANLGLPTRTLDSKIRRLGIDKYRFKVPRAS